MTYAHRLVQFPLGVAGVALATASFPRIAEQFEKKQDQKAAQTFTAVIKYLLLIMIPSAVGFLVLGEDIVGAIYDRGFFHERGWLRPTYLTLSFYSLGLFGYAMVKVLARVFQAQHDFYTPVKTGLIGVALNILLCVLFIWREWPLWTLALASSIASSANAGLMLIILRWRMRDLRLFSTFRFSVRVLLASVGMALTCALFLAFCPIEGGTLLYYSIRVALGIAVSAAAYGAFGYWLFYEELMRLIKRK